ncbi:MAG: DNA primase [Candidatus Aenigmatarchaeota archaeon]|nr:MAG: DNA primase [Candidatus Aenigmarchaeota archaeon]
MSKLAPTSIKYTIKAHIKAKGVIEKPDVIGAIFGQTEGLLGSDLDLRELQRTGRIGRIEVTLKSIGGNTEGDILIPSSLDAAETALIAATIETIERIGPCVAKIKLESVEDMRSEKRKYVIEKAKEILKNLIQSGVPSSEEISEQIKEAVRTHEISSYHGLPCGPNIMDSDNIIIVEGRADVVNLLRYGIRNAIALEGTSVPKSIIDLTKQKVVTVLVDGDRGGKLIIKELLQSADIDYVAMAPQGKEVEELTKKEVYKALRDKVSAEQFKMEAKNNNSVPKETKKEKRLVLQSEQKKLFKQTLDELIGTRAACIFNSENKLLGKVPVSELVKTLNTIENPYIVIFDGKVDYKLNSIARKKGIKFLIGMEKERIQTPVIILSKDDLIE